MHGHRRFVALASVLAFVVSGVGLEFGPVGVAAGGETTVLLKNGGFEKAANPSTGLPRYWSTNSWGDLATMSWVSDVHHGGDFSVQISASTPDDAAWIQTVAVVPHTLYRLSGWIRVRGVASTRGGGANLCFYGTWTHTAGLTRNHQWTSVSVVMDSGDQQQLTVGARLGYWADNATGNAWFDNVKLTPIGPA